MARIPRVFQKIFGSNASNNGQFGSAQLGTKVNSNDLSVLQALSAWSNGWIDATIGGNNLPTLEEMQGLDYVQTTQLAYIFQDGIPEYDGSTTYFQHSIVKKTGTYQLYGSLTDTNVGHALTDGTNWVLLLDLSNPTNGLALLSAHILVGNGSNQAASVAVTGDISITNAGVTAIKSSVGLAGSPTTTTQSPGDNSTRIATTAYVDGSHPTSTTYQYLTSTSGTYNLPANCKGILVRMVGGGGGGGGVGSGSTAGSAGSNSSFGSITNVGGSGGGAGTTSSSSGNGGAGGTGGSGSASLRIGGAAGCSYGNASGSIIAGGAGGASTFGGAGGSTHAAAGGAGSTNSGSGGAGGPTTATYFPGGGGGAGEYSETYIPSPSSTYSYSAGAGGGGGTGSTFAGGAGGSGMIIVTEYY